MFCQSCGSQNPDDSKFCLNCGAPLSGSQPMQQPVQPMQQQPTMVVNINQESKKDPELGSSYATTSLVCGIISVLLSGIFLPSFILSIVGIKKAGTAKVLGYSGGKRVLGKTLSIIGLILSFVMPWILVFSVLTTGVSSYLDQAKKASVEIEKHNEEISEEIDEDEDDENDSDSEEEDDEEESEDEE